MNNKKKSHAELHDMFVNAMRELDALKTLGASKRPSSAELTEQSESDFETFDIDDISADCESDNDMSAYSIAPYCCDSLPPTPVANDEASSTDKSTDAKTIGYMLFRKANNAIRAGRLKSMPKALYDGFWNEGELACLFADSNVGKSILSVQIADHITRRLGKKVHYYDFELSEKQFQMRYTDEQTDLSYTFSDLLTIARFDHSAALADENGDVIDIIERAAKEDECDVIIIDNISVLNNQLESGEAAGRLMARLMELKHSMNLSVLVIAHTPKRDLSQPITQNDLAGSKRLFNFFDSVFAMGKSATDSDIRYLKQIKARNGRIIYDTPSVLMGEIVKEEAMLKFVERTTVNEYSLLKSVDESSQSIKLQRIVSLSEQGKSCREIAEQLGISKSTVSRALSKAKAERENV